MHPLSKCLARKKNEVRQVNQNPFKNIDKISLGHLVTDAANDDATRFEHWDRVPMTSGRQCQGWYRLGKLVSLSYRYRLSTIFATTEGPRLRQVSLPLLFCLSVLRGEENFLFLFFFFSLFFCGCGCSSLSSSDIFAAPIP